MRPEGAKKNVQVCIEIKKVKEHQEKFEMMKEVIERIRKKEARLKMREEKLKVSREPPEDLRQAHPVHAMQLKAKKGGRRRVRRRSLLLQARSLHTSLNRCMLIYTIRDKDYTPPPPINVYSV